MNPSKLDFFRVDYLNQNGEKVEKILDGFTAKVFQHEYDHLQGIVNVLKNGATVKEFATRDEFIDFFKSFKESNQDKIKRTAPKEVN